MLTPQSTPQYDIIVETLTGSELKVTVTEKDTIGYIKSRIQKYEGIPVGHQHLLYNHNELSDTTEMKDIPLVKGSRLKLVLGLKGGPVSARRVVTLPDYENWFDLSDVLNTSRQEPLTISTPGVKVLVYKDCKKNIHRLMKFRTGKNLLTKGSEEHTEAATNESQNDQWLNDNINTLEKMHQLRTKLEWKKRNKTPKSSGTNHSKSTESRSMEMISCSHSKCNIETEIGRKLRRLGFMSKARAPVVTDIVTTMENSLKADSSGGSSRMGNKMDGDGGKNWCQSNEKINNNNSYFFNHRHSQGSLKVAQPLVNVNYFNVGGRSKSAKPPTTAIGEFSKMKIRENIRRNRSFKTINTESDMVIEENQVHGSSKCLDSVLRRPSNARSREEQQIAEQTKVQEFEKFIEQFSKSRITSLSDPCGERGVGKCEKEKKLNKRSILSKHLSTASFENKLFVEHQHTFAINNHGESRASCSSDFQLDTTNADTAYRVFKLPSENGNNYELPKLLIREDSPVESFHSSDSQLETLALRGESPKTVLDSFAKIESDDGSGADPKVSSSTESILQLYDSPSSTKNSRQELLNVLDSGGGGGGGGDVGGKGAVCKKSSSDIGLSNLELNFLNDDPADGAECDGAAGACLQIGRKDLDDDDGLMKMGGAGGGGGDCWKTGSPLDFDKQSPQSSTSFNFMSSGDISPTDDDDDVFNSCEMLHHGGTGGKSKSVELNEFRMMFGSSPTLLNNYSGGGGGGGGGIGGVTSSGTAGSRLNGISAASPFMYRRHPADTCLSSSTSDLECLPGRVKGESVTGGAKGGRELPSLLRHRNNEHLDYMRSYENLDRTKIVRLRNDKVTAVNGGGGGERDWRVFDGSNSDHMSHEHLPGQDPTDDFSAFARLNYHHHHHHHDHHHHHHGVGGSGSSSNGDFPVSFPSNESLFNINFDTFEDDVIEIDTLGMFDGAQGNNGLILPEINDAQVKFATSTATASSSSTTISGKKCHSNNVDGIVGTMAKTTEIDDVDDAAIVGGVVKKGKKLRCAECKKKLGLIMVMRCHCEKVFCPQHRYAEAHNCSYNFKQEGRKILARENPLVVAQKLPKI